MVSRLLYDFTLSQIIVQFSPCFCKGVYVSFDVPVYLITYRLQNSNSTQKPVIVCIWIVDITYIIYLHQYIYMFILMVLDELT